MALSRGPGWWCATAATCDRFSRAKSSRMHSPSSHAISRLGTLFLFKPPPALLSGLSFHQEHLTALLAHLVGPHKLVKWWGPVRSQTGLCGDGSAPKPASEHRLSVMFHLMINDNSTACQLMGTPFPTDGDVLHLCLFLFVL
jgi:hypothetical protein